MAIFSFLKLTNMKRGNGPLFCALRHLEIYFRLKPMKQQQNLALINQSSPTRLYFSNLKWPVSDFTKEEISF